MARARTASGTPTAFHNKAQGMRRFAAYPGSTSKKWTTNPNGVPQQNVQPRWGCVMNGGALTQGGAAAANRRDSLPWASLFDPWVDPIALFVLPIRSESLSCHNHWFNFTRTSYPQ